MPANDPDVVSSGQEARELTEHDRISVILPYYNRVDTLAQAARSVLNQTHRKLVLYLIDDASTDSSRDVAHQLDDKRIVHVDVERNSGVSEVRNIGLAHSGDALVAFMDSDDVWLEQKLEVQISRLRMAQKYGPVSVVGCGWVPLAAGASSGEFRVGPFSRTDVLANRVRGIGTPTLLVDRSAAAKGAGFDPRMPALEDRDFVISCLANESKVIVVPEILVRVRRSRLDHSATPRRASKGWECMIAKYENELAADPALSSWYSFRVCREHLLSGNLRESRKHFSAALRAQRLRRAIHLMAGFVGRSKGIAIAQRLLPL
jgi:glycosyltransferase involved in cell wall biosynthesis